MDDREFEDLLCYLENEELFNEVPESERDELVYYISYADFVRELQICYEEQITAEEEEESTADDREGPPEIEIIILPNDPELFILNNGISELIYALSTTLELVDAVIDL